jgi:uncharacterized protein (TIGR01777 family)
MKILITGATGFIGKELLVRLFRENHELVVLSRNPEKARRTLEVPCEVFPWNPLQEKVPSAALSGVEAVIHLAGEPIANHRWTPLQKKKILDSRVISTAHLFESLRSQKSSKVHTVICSSAIGYYGDRGNEVLTEESSAGTGFLSEVCQKWENESLKEKLPGVRQVILRTGIVLGKEGGMLAQLLPLFRFGLGGPVGGGNAWMSWIHREDLISLFIFALDHPQIEGVLNGVGPQPVTNLDFTRILGTVLHRPTLVPVPGRVIRLALGEMATLVLGSQKVLPEKANLAGFKFAYPQLFSALSQICAHLNDEEFHSLQYIQKTPESIFSFFSQAENLEKMTPPWLKFRVVKKSNSNLGQDTLIDYKLNVHGFPLRWQSKIEDWIPNRCFVDSQIRGPYAKWHHIHLFEALNGGTLISDQVLYRVPGGVIGKLILGKKIKKDISQIFQYRRAKIQEVFRHEST